MKKLLIIISILCIGIFSYAQLPSPTSHQTLNNREQMGVFRGKLNTNGINTVNYLTLVRDTINNFSDRIKLLEAGGIGGGTTLDSLNLEWGEVYGLDHYIVLKKSDPIWGYALDLDINWSGFDPNGKGFKFIFDNGSAGNTSILSNNKFISFRDTSITISTNLTNNLEGRYDRWVFGPTYIWKEELMGNRRLAFYDEVNSVSSVDSFWYSDDNGTNGRLLYPKLPYTNIVLTNQASWIGSSPRMLTLNNNHNSCDIFQINNLGSGSSAVGFNLQNGQGIGFYLRNGEGTGLLLDDINTGANGLSIRHFPSTGYGLQITGTTDNILFKVKNDSSIFGNELILIDSISLSYEGKSSHERIVGLSKTGKLKSIELTQNVQIEITNAELTSGEESGYIFAIPEALDDMDLIKMEAYPGDVTGDQTALAVTCYRKRSGTEVSMTTTGASFSTNAVINTTNEDVQRGDQLEFRWTFSGGSTAPTGLIVQLTFQ